MLILFFSIRLLFSSCSSGVKKSLKNYVARLRNGLGQAPIMIGCLCVVWGPFQLKSDSRWECVRWAWVCVFVRVKRVCVCWARAREWVGESVSDAINLEIPTLYSSLATPFKNEREWERASVWVESEPRDGATFSELFAMQGLAIFLFPRSKAIWWRFSWIVWIIIVMTSDASAGKCGVKPINSRKLLRYLSSIEPQKIRDKSPFRSYNKERAERAKLVCERARERD